GYTYRLAVDGTTVYTGANNSFSWNTSAVANGSHTLTATVTDSGGKSGSASIRVNVSNTTSPPPAGGLKAIFTSPAEGATVSGTQVSVNLWVEGQSGSSNTFSLSVDSQSLGSRTTSGTHVTIAWDSTKVPDGVHTLTATVRDAAGNTGTASRTVTTKNGVGGTSLTASITAPAANATVSATTTVSMAVSGAAAGSNTFTLSVDGTVVSTQTVSGTGASYAWDTTKAANGTRTLSLTTRDSTGKTATTSRSVNVSNTSTAGLKVIITSPKAGATVNGNATVNVWVEGASGSANAFTLNVDNRVIGSSTESDRHAWFTWSTRSDTNGTHTMKATVRDAAGNTGTSTITVRVRN
ncbi:MAG: Ig-like domain-containing protein, partial [Candidatus Rokuibacteriota bacterium]